MQSLEGKVMAQMNWQKLMDERVREDLTKSEFNRQMAVAMFPMCAASAANDLRRLLLLQRDGIDSEQAQEARDYIESRIRNQFREWFGRDMVDGI